MKCKERSGYLDNTEFDAVAFMRKRREEISLEIQHLSVEEKLKYFTEKAQEFARLTEQQN
jgi:hypothetical protein